MISVLERAYLTFLSLMGTGAFIASVVGFFLLHDPSKGISRDLLFVALAVPAGWLKIKLEPSGHLTLAPVPVIASMFLASPAVPVLVAVLSAFVGAVVFSRQGTRRGLEEAGEEAGPAVLATWFVYKAGILVPQVTQVSWLLLFVATLLVYALTRLLLGAIRAFVSDGIRFTTFVLSSGWTILANFAIFAVVSLGLVLLARVLGGLGYLTLALAMIALVESYHPFKLLSDQRDVLYASLSMIAQAIDMKDPYTGRHARDASGVAVRVARSLGLPESEVRKVRVAGILHDIGKIGVSGKVIRKAGALEPEEMAQMKRHPLIGALIMQPVELLSGAAEIVRHHHEHFDGSGYPDGLRGEEIPIGARVVLVADAFNAMTTDRPYRRAMLKNEALRVLRENAGKQFDPKIVQALNSVVDRI